MHSYSKVEFSANVKPLQPHQLIPNFQPMYSPDGVDPSVSRQIQEILKISPPPADEEGCSTEQLDLSSLSLDSNSIGYQYLHNRSSSFTGHERSFNGASANGASANCFESSEFAVRKFQEDEFLEQNKSFRDAEEVEQMKRFRKFQEDERNFRLRYEEGQKNWSSFADRDQTHRPQRTQSLSNTGSIYDFAPSPASLHPERKFDFDDLSSSSLLDMSLDRKWNAQPEAPSNSRFLSDLSLPPFHSNNRSSIRLIKGSTTWEGSLPQRRFDITRDYSKKVFIGGVPRDITEEELLMIFGRFKDIKIEWPSNSVNSRSTPKGYLYIIFNNHSSICDLLADCKVERHGGCEEFNYYVQYKRFMSKPIQIIPWRISDSQCFYCDPAELQNNRMTVFVGALHGRLYAEAIGSIFEEVFHNVVYVEIDTDRYKYPIGSGRVTFSDRKSYQMAIKANYICIETEKFSKKIQIEPYIEDQVCGKCQVDSAPNFCKQAECFEYYCNKCWLWQHSINSLQDHQPVRRKNKIDRSF